MFRSFFTTIFRGSSAVLCAVTVPPADLHSLSLYYYAVCGRMCTRSANKVMRLIQYNSVLTFKLQIEFVPFKIVPLGGYTPPETLFPLFVATLVVANRNRF